MSGATSFVCDLTVEQRAELRELLECKGFDLSVAQYVDFRAKGEQVTIIAYSSGKLVVQGKGTADFVQFVLEPEILHTFTFGYENVLAKEQDETITPHCGVDESGKGDFFGPLVIAGVYVNAITGPELRKLGACDSKLINSSNRIFELSEKIRKICQGQFSVVTLMPEAYNRVYDQIGNLNRLLAWGHARAIENVLTLVPDCPRALSDKFGNEFLIKSALMERGRKIALDQQVRAESDIAVAAASILAREGFLLGMKKISGIVGCELPRGAGPQVKKIAATLMKDKGADIFSSCAKLHFKTYTELQAK